MATRKSNEKNTDDQEPQEVAGNKVGGSCNVPGCLLDAETRGLCEAHWYTHRGLADMEPVEETGPEVAMP